MGKQSSIDPALSAMVNLDSIDTKSAVKELEKSARPEKGERKPATAVKKERTAQTFRPSPSEKKQPSTSKRVRLLGVTSETLIRFQSMKQIVSSMEKRRLGNSEFLELLLQERAQSLPEGSKKLFLELSDLLKGISSDE